MRRILGVVQWIVGVATLAAFIMMFTLGGPRESPSAPSSAESGAAIYADKCAICHGDAGQGGTGPPLAGFMIEAFPDIAEEVELVTSGSRGMPAFASRLDPDEILAVVEYTREGL